MESNIIDFSNSDENTEKTIKTITEEKNEIFRS